MTKMPIVAVRRPSHLYLHRCDGDGGSRFIDLFHRSWERLPEGVRRRLLYYWTTHRADGPRIELLDDWPDRGTATACVDRRGHRIRFFAPDMASDAGDEAIMGVIAHELAHVHQWAVRRKPADYDAGEEDADALSERWGFWPRAFELHLAWADAPGENDVPQP